MPLGLHPDCQERLKKLIAENLAHVRADNGTFLVFPSTSSLLFADEVLPQTGLLHDSLQKLIGEFPIFDFLVDTLSRELYESGTYISEKTGQLLQEFSNYKDLTIVAGRLVNDFESLPWSYLISLELPPIVGNQIRAATISFPLASSLKVVVPDQTTDSMYPLRSGIKKRDERLFGGPTILTGSRSKQWNKEAAYIQINTEGFIGSGLETMPISEAIGTVKSFIGLSLATRLMNVAEKKVGLLGMISASYQSRLIVHRKLGDSWQIWSTYGLPNDLSTTLNNLEIHDLDGHLKTEQQRNDWIKNRLEVISTAFRNPDKAEQVLLAAQWLLDGYAGANELLSFVQTTVAMEILLGEKAKSDIIGVGELLRNRCAYLIGTSRSQREKILKDFDSIYDVRSNIVHRGKSRLTLEERKLFSKLQWMCRAVITKELELVAKDKNDTK